MVTKTFFGAVIFTLCASQSVFAGDSVERRFVKADGESMSWVGRVDLKKGYADFTFPGVQMHTDFTGSSLQLLTKANSGYFVVEIDNRPAFKVHSTAADSLLTLATNLGKRRHKAVVTLVSEGYEMLPRIYGVYVDKDATVSRAALPGRKIEFIGNSITCGYGNEAESEKCGFDYATENQWDAYDALTARKLNAQCFVVARSGIGIYRYYGAPRQGTDYNMPNTYKYTQFGQKGELWDFSRFTPDVVCLNLGTNDTSLDTYDTELLTRGYVEFVKTLRSHYPNAKIVLLTGTMMSGKALDDVKRALDTAKKAAADRGDSNVYRFDMTPMMPGAGVYGADWHPSAASHQRMADELSAYLRWLMGWQ